MPRTFVCKACRCVESQKKSSPARSVAPAMYTTPYTTTHTTSHYIYSTSPCPRARHAPAVRVDTTSHHNSPTVCLCASYAPTIGKSHLALRSRKPFQFSKKYRFARSDAPAMHTAPYTTHAPYHIITYHTHARASPRSGTPLQKSIACAL